MLHLGGVQGEESAEFKKLQDEISEIFNSFKFKSANMLQKRRKGKKEPKLVTYPISSVIPPVVTVDYSTGDTGKAAIEFNLKPAPVMKFSYEELLAACPEELARLGRVPGDTSESDEDSGLEHEEEISTDSEKE